MDCTEYAETKRKAAKKISADIRERWNNRIVQRELHLMGEAGALQYLSDYGRGIGTAKVIGFALCAESEGYPEMAMGFWKRAFELETGEKPIALNATTNIAPAKKLTASAKKENLTNPIVAELPSHLQLHPRCRSPPVPSSAESGWKSMTSFRRRAGETRRPR